MSHIVNTLIDEFKKDVEEGAYEVMTESPKECKICGCTSTEEEVANGDEQHWDDCPIIKEPADFSGASDVPGYSPDR